MSADNYLIVNDDGRVIHARGASGAAGPIHLAMDVEAAHVYVERSGGAWFEVSVDAESGSDGYWSITRSTLVPSDQGWLLTVPAPKLPQLPGFQDQVTVTVKVPEGGHLRAVVGSGTLSVDCPQETLIARMVSGRLSADGVEHVDATMTDGTIDIGFATRVSLVLIDGRVRIGKADIVDIDARSADVEIDWLLKRATISVISGQVRVHSDTEPWPGGPFLYGGVVDGTVRTSGTVTRADRR